MSWDEGRGGCWPQCRAASQPGTASSASAFAWIQKNAVQFPGPAAGRRSRSPPAQRVVARRVEGAAAVDGVAPPGGVGTATAFTSLPFADGCSQRLADGASSMRALMRGRPDARGCGPATRAARRQAQPPPGRPAHGGGGRSREPTFRLRVTPLRCGGFHIDHVEGGRAGPAPPWRRCGRQVLTIGSRASARMSIRAIIALQRQAEQPGLPASSCVCVPGSRA